MKRGAVIGVVLAVVLAAGVAGAFAVSLGERSADADAGGVGSTPASTSSPTAGPGGPSPSGAPAAAPTAETLPPGEYADYSVAALEAVEGTAVLFFHAPWCPQCRALEEDILAREVPDGITVLKVDYDSNQDLRQQHGVTIQTTVVRLDDSGDAVQTFVPYDDPTLETALAGLGLAP
jgi:thiol-disulfide isomerase/thioredoxin